MPDASIAPTAPLSEQHVQIVSPAMGEILIHPADRPVEGAPDPAFIVYPSSIGHQPLETIVDWAAATQSPIFCLPQDIPDLVDEGFSSYRFHRLDGFREVGFQNGSIEFYPARPPATGVFSQLIRDVAGAAGLAKPNAFHVLVRPRRETAVLYLASPKIDRFEWATLMRSRPGIILGSPNFPAHIWKEFSLMFGVVVRTGLDLRNVATTNTPSIAASSKNVQSL